MPVIPIRNLVRGGGLNKDEQPNSLPPGAFNELINVRAKSGRFERFGDTVAFQDSYTNPELAEPRAIFDIVLQGAAGILLITGTGVFYDVGSGWIDISPSYFSIVDSPDWTMEQYGDSFILCSPDDEPMIFVAGTLEVQQFTDWPSGYRSGRIFAYKNFLVAVNVSVGGDDQGGLVVWSDVVLDGDVVNVEWSNLTTNLAGENILPDGSGKVIEGGVLRDSAILYTDTTVWQMNLTNTVAGTTPLVFNFRRVFADDGILAPRCFVEVGGMHYVIGFNRIYVHDGFNRKSISDNRVNAFFYSRLGTEGFAYVMHYPRPQEIVFAFATRELDQASEALVYNYQYDVWSRWVFSEDEGVFRYMIVGPKFDQNVPSWANVVGTWADFNATTWDQLFPNLREQIAYGLDTVGQRILMADSDTENTETPFTLTIQRSDLDLDEVFQQVQTIRHIKRLIPLISGEGVVVIEVGGRNVLASPIQWHSPMNFVIGTDYKVDMRRSYRFPAVRFTQTSAQGRMSISGFDIEIMKSSKR